MYVSKIDKTVFRNVFSLLGLWLWCWYVLKTAVLEITDDAYVYLEKMNIYIIIKNIWVLNKKYRKYLIQTSIYLILPLSFSHTENDFGCTEGVDPGLHHEQKQERKGVLQHRRGRLDVYSSAAVSEPQTHRVRGSGYRVVSLVLCTRVLCMPLPGRRALLYM